ncbi:MAG: hypothetical protein K2M19_04735 [Muribaculaceae bacterium]|nr:hypothetical protein [Muribaculaceae bacterium]
MKLYIHLILTLLILSSCSLLQEPEVPCPPAGDGIMLSFRINTQESGLQSRDDDHGHTEVESEYRQFEDGIDLHDIGMFIFAKMADAPGEEKLIVKVVDIATSFKSDNMEVSGGPGFYTVNITLLRQQLNDILGTEITPAGTARVQFRILMLVNSSTKGTGAGGSLSQYRWNRIDGNTYSSIIADNDHGLGSWTYTMGYLCNFNNENNMDEQTEKASITDLYPNPTGRPYIPMFGTMIQTVSQSVLYNSRPDNRVFLGELDMLRAVAKVRVVDNIDNKNADGYPKIVNAALIGSQSYLCPVPNGALTYQNGTQVHTPRLANPEYESNDINKFTYRLGVMPAAWTDLPPTAYRGEIFAGYIPEMGIFHINNDVNQGLPLFRISVAISKDSDGKEIIKLYEVPMTAYSGENFEFGNAILRNHIYTLSVKHVNNSDLILNVAVKDWRTISYQYEY